MSTATLPGTRADTFDPTRVAWVLDDAGLNRLDAAIARCAEVVLDLETTGLDEHATTGGETNGGVAARVVLASLTLPTPEENAGSDQADTWVVPLSHPSSPFVGRWRAVLGRIAGTIRSYEKPLTNQHVKFDAKWVEATCGEDLSGQISWCTQVGSHLLDETVSTSLKERAPLVFGVTRWDDFDLTYPGASEDVPVFDLGLYAARDTYWTWRLAQYQRAQMFLTEEGVPPEGQEEVTDARLGTLSVWCAMPMVSTLTAIEQRGILLDQPWVREHLRENLEAVRTLTEELAGRYTATWPKDGPTEVSFAPTSHWFAEFTRQAVACDDLRVASLTPNGNPQWSKAVLVRQARAGLTVAQRVLDLRGHVKRAEYLTSWLHWATPGSSIHTTYWAGRVVTGRLSSEGPNMQQVTAALKPAFVPHDGYLLAELDYSQIELRVAAMISECRPMTEAFQHGEDLHRLLAARITGKPQEEVTPIERQAGKSANFGLLYGMGVAGFQQYAETVYGVSFTDEEAALVHRTFFETWAGLSYWHARSVARARATGQVVSPIGRVRRLPDIRSGIPALEGYAERASINAPVQGFASDLMQMAAASIEGTLPGSTRVAAARIVGTVHDSIVVEVPQDSYAETVGSCIERMLDLDRPLGRLGTRLTIPLAVEAKVGTRWGLSDVAVISS